MAPLPRKPTVPRVTSIKPQPTTGAAPLPYSIQKAPGGSYHSYPDGRRVFVAAKSSFVGGKSTLGSGLAGRFPAPPATPGAPATESAASAAAAQASAGDDGIVDAQWAADQAAALKARQDKSAQLTADDTGDEVNYREALRRFREQQPRQLRSNLVSANQRGLAESTVRSEADADTVIQNQRQETDMSGARAERAAAREAARRALEQGGTVEDAARLAEAADRKINYYTDRAEEGSLAVNPGSPASGQLPAPINRVPATKKSAPSKSFKTVVKGGRVLHYYGTGKKTRKVDVRAATKRPTRRAN